MSILRLGLNWSSISVDPTAFMDVIVSKPVSVENCCSSGIATDDSMILALMPGRTAETMMIEKCCWLNAREPLVARDAE